MKNLGAARALQLVKALILISLCALVSSCAINQSPPVEEKDLDLLERARIILSTQSVGDKKKLDEELTHVYRKLDNRLESNQFDKAIRPLGHYFRGSIGWRLQGANVEDGRPIDLALAKKNIRDFDVVADQEKESEESQSSLISDSLYFAGLISLNELKDESRALQYFGRCAELGHAGCANVVAIASEFGQYGQKINLEKAVRLHKKVVDTGTAFTCAGSYSASAIARIVFYQNVITPEGDDQYWLQTSHRLASEASKKTMTDAPCGMRGIEITTYLYQLSRGVPSAKLRDIPTRPDDSPRDVPNWALERLLLGKMSQANFDDTITAETRAVTRCVAWHSAAMFFALSGDENSKQKYRSLFFKEDDPFCVGLRPQFSKVDTLTPIAAR
ncbi:MAG: hypothetical protein ACK5DL_03825 [Burkholderiales bacterium]|jgi:hypothetical protein|nr:hypothetical protein [Betaproteobacteria bacterium]